MPPHIESERVGEKMHTGLIPSRLLAIAAMLDCYI